MADEKNRDVPRGWALRATLRKDSPPERTEYMGADSSPTHSLETTQTLPRVEAAERAVRAAMAIAPARQPGQDVLDLTDPLNPRWRRESEMPPGSHIVHFTDGEEAAPAEGRTYSPKRAQRVRENLDGVLQALRQEQARLKELRADRLRLSDEVVQLEREKKQLQLHVDKLSGLKVELADQCEGLKGALRSLATEAEGLRRAKASQGGKRAAVQPEATVLPVVSEHMALYAVTFNSGTLVDYVIVPFNVSMQTVLQAQGKHGEVTRIERLGTVAVPVK